MTTDIMWGIERNPEAPGYGDLILPALLVHKDPRPLTSVENLAGVIKHGETVDVLGYEQIRKKTWALVHWEHEITPEEAETTAVKDAGNKAGDMIVVHGYVSARVLKEAGEAYI